MFSSFRFSCRFGFAAGACFSGSCFFMCGGSAMFPFYFRAGGGLGGGVFTALWSSSGYGGGGAGMYHFG
jgi:hypothetical protein